MQPLWPCQAHSFQPCWLLLHVIGEEPPVRQTLSNLISPASFLPTFISQTFWVLRGEPKNSCEPESSWSLLVDCLLEGTPSGTHNPPRLSPPLICETVFQGGFTSHDGVLEFAAALHVRRMAFGVSTATCLPSALFTDSSGRIRGLPGSASLISPGQHRCRLFLARLLSSVSLIATITFF
jgi:hypothetical protein